MYWVVLFQKSNFFPDGNIQCTVSQIYTVLIIYRERCGCELKEGPLTAAHKHKSPDLPLHTACLYYFNIFISKSYGLRKFRKCLFDSKNFISGLIPLPRQSSIESIRNFQKKYNIWNSQFFTLKWVYLYLPSKVPNHKTPRKWTFQNQTKKILKIWAHNFEKQKS